MVAKTLRSLHPGEEYIKSWHRTYAIILDSNIIH